MQLKKGQSVYIPSSEQNIVLTCVTPKWVYFSNNKCKRIRISRLTFEKNIEKGIYKL